MLGLIRFRLHLFPAFSCSTELPLYVRWPNGALTFSFFPKTTTAKLLSCRAQPDKADIISNPAISDAIGKYDKISDAVGFCYQQGSHIFYMLSFPSANATWRYDLSIRTLA